MSVKKVDLAKGAEGLFIKNERFNTSLISFNFYMPLRSQTAAPYGLLPFVLSTCSEKYPNFSKLNFKLSKLYGANLISSVEKVGDFQLLKVGISVIDDRLTLDGEELSEQAADLLCGLIFNPRVENGEFFCEDIEREKRKAIEHIRSEKGDKRIYSKNRLIEEMYGDSAYGVSKCGSESGVAEVSGKSLFEAWEKVLKSAYLRVNVISSSEPDKLFKNIGEKLSKIQREDITDCSKSLPTPKAAQVKMVNEEMNVNQGKLVMGFSSDLHGDDKTATALTVMCDIFGGGPYSRLFTNVREKLSLCYYCSAAAVKSKGLLTVSSGVEARNAEKAQMEILNQLSMVKKGMFGDFEFESSKKSIIDSLKSYNDSQSLIDLWYSVKVSGDQLISTEELAECVANVTREEVIDAARGVNLHTVYCLMPKGE